MRPRGRPACGRRDRARQSTEGRAPKNDPALFALAIAAGLGDDDDAPGGARRRCRGWPHGHAPVPVRAFVEGFRGWGRSLRRAVGGWYAARPVDALAYQAVKYRQRDGRDAPRPAAPRSPGRHGVGAATRRSTSRTSTLACSSGSSAAATTDGLPRLVEGFARAQAATTPTRDGRARARVPAAARGAQAGAPHLARRCGRRCSTTCR